MSKENPTRIGVIGTGYISKGFTDLVSHSEGLEVSKILTRRNIDDIKDMPGQDGKITQSVNEVIDNSDMIVEVSGDPIHGTDIVKAALEAGIPVVTMNSELQVTTGSWLSEKGFLTEAEGDQPGSIAALEKEVIEMGFDPIVLGNVKGYLNHTPTYEDMKFYAEKQGISIGQVTSFTDGTKVQIEQALVANGLGADIAKDGLVGPSSPKGDLETGAQELARVANELGIKISDYIVMPGSKGEVFVVAKHEESQVPFLKYYKMGEGPFYVITRGFHLCHMEMLKTVRRVIKGTETPFNNSNRPTVSVAAIAKKQLVAGEIIQRGMGSFEMRGEAVKIESHTDHVPIGLIFDVVVKRNIEPGQIITFDDLEIPETTALLAWQETVAKSQKELK